MSQPPNQPPSSAPGPPPENFGRWPPGPYGWSPVSYHEMVRSKVLAPGIAMIVLGSFGLVLSIFWEVWVPVLLPLLPPDMAPPPQIKTFYFWFSLVIGSLSLIPNLGIIIGGIAMVRFRSRMVAMMGAVMAMLNMCQLGIFGLGVGIWALVILTQADVRAAFQAAQNEAAGAVSLSAPQTCTEPDTPDSTTGQTNTGTAES